MSIRVGLIGYGAASATLHVPLITHTAGLTLTRIASARPEAVARDLPHLPVAKQAGELMQANDVDLIVIATPNTSHHTLVRQALEAGKHVVVEKPFTVDAAEAAALTALAAEKRRLLSVFHNRRWDGDFLTVQHCLKNSLLGEPNTFFSSFDRYRPDVHLRWREQDQPGAGTLFDLGSHLIDQALVLFGMPHTVTADIGIQREGALAPDYFHLTLGYGKLRAILRAGSLVCQPGPRFQLHGSHGSYCKHGEDVQEAALQAGAVPGGTGWGMEPPSAAGTLTLRENERNTSSRLDTLPGNYPAFYAGMVEAIAHGGPVPVSPEDATRVIQVIEAAVRSSNEGRTIPLA